MDEAVTELTSFRGMPLDLDAVAQVTEAMLRHGEGMTHSPNQLASWVPLAVSEEGTELVRLRAADGLRKDVHVVKVSG
jgi:hypothetical protein